MGRDQGLVRDLEAAGRDMTDIDLTPVAHQTLVQRLGKEVASRGVHVLATPWLPDDFTGDVEVQITCATLNDAILLKLALSGRHS